MNIIVLTDDQLKEFMDILNYMKDQCSPEDSELLYQLAEDVKELLT